MGEVPAREVLWNITGHWLIYPCFIAALAVAVVFFVRRWRLWKIGEPENRSDRRGERLRGAVRDALLQVKVAERRGPGLVHGAMYVAMVILLIATATVAAQADLGLPLVQGNFYLYFLSLAVDIAGAAFCIAMVACIVRRIANRALDTRPGDIVVLGLLLAIGVTGFVLEGLRIAGTGDPWGAWSPVGSLFAGLFASWDQGQIELAHRVLWWFHMALAFGLIAYWTYSKLVHVLLVPAGVYWRDLKPKGELPFIDMEDEGLLSFGCGRLEELTWKDLFDTQACVRCNRCQDLCPAYATGKPLSPKAFIQDLGAELEQRGPIIYRLQKEAALEKNGAAADEGGKGSKAVLELPASEALLENADLTDAERAIIDRSLVGAVIAPGTLWACTTCGACMEACPAFVEHVPKVVKMRTYQVSMESALPAGGPGHLPQPGEQRQPVGAGLADPRQVGRGAGCAHHRRGPRCRVPLLARLLRGLRRTQPQGVRGLGVAARGGGCELRHLGQRGEVLRGRGAEDGQRVRLLHAGQREHRHASGLRGQEDHPRSALTATRPWPGTTLSWAAISR